MNINYDIVVGIYQNIIKHTNGCWIWHGTLTNTGWPVLNYYKTKINPKKKLYIIFFDVIPTRLVYICDNKLCVNPQHAKQFEKYDSYRFIEKFWEKVDVGSINDCWLWKNKYGRYGKYYIYDELGNRVYISSHKYAWEITNGKVPDGLYVCHKCDNGFCCNPNHLFLGTPLDNIEDCYNKYRALKVIGEGVKQSKLNWDIVDYIRTSNKTNSELATELNVVSGTIYNVRHNLTWKEENRGLKIKSYGTN